MPRHGPRVALCLAALCLSRLVMADDVVLANGDRLSGRLLHKGGEVLTFETPPAGQLKIRWSDVVALSTDRAVEIWLAGETAPRRAVLSSAFDGTVDLVGDESDVPLVKIAFINPTPEESGVGALYNGHVTASASRVRGNVDTQQSYADADYTGRSRDYRYTLTGKFTQNRDHGVKIASNWLFTGNVDYFLTPKRFLYLRGSRESDRFKGVDRRSTVGAGYGLQLIETLRSNVSLRAGIDYVNLNRLPPAEDTRYPALGWGIRASHKLAERGTELFHEQDGYFNLRNSEQINLRSRSGIRVPLYIGLNASAQVNIDWDRDPTPGRKTLDTTFLLGLGYTW